MRRTLNNSREPNISFTNIPLIEGYLPRNNSHCEINFNAISSCNIDFQSETENCDEICNLNNNINSMDNNVSNIFHINNFHSIHFVNTCPVNNSFNSIRFGNIILDAVDNTFGRCDDNFGFNNYNNIVLNNSRRHSERSRHRTTFPNNVHNH